MWSHTVMAKLIGVCYKQVYLYYPYITGMLYWETDLVCLAFLQENKIKFNTDTSFARVFMYIKFGWTCLTVLFSVVLWTTKKFKFVFSVQLYVATQISTRFGKKTTTTTNKNPLQFWYYCKLSYNRAGTKRDLILSEHISLGW